MTRLMLVVAVLCGCAETGPTGPRGAAGATGAPGAPGLTGAPGEGFHSGARLKARYAESDDGAREFLGWFDTDLGVPCDFQPDRRQLVEPSRCLPYDPQQGGRVLFADDACAIRAVEVPAGPVERGAKFCALRDGLGPARWHPLGAAVAVPDLRIRNNDGCSPAAVSGDLGQFYACGDLPEVPAEAFAEFREDPVE